MQKYRLIGTERYTIEDVYAKANRNIDKKNKKNVDVEIRKWGKGWAKERYPQKQM